MGSTVFQKLLRRDSRGPIDSADEFEDEESRAISLAGENGCSTVRKSPVLGRAECSKSHDRPQTLE